MVEVNGKPCVKLSEEFQKVTFPGKKNAYRLYDRENRSIVDLLTKSDEPAPVIGQKFLCRHPFIVDYYFFILIIIIIIFIILIIRKQKELLYHPIMWSHCLCHFGLMVDYVQKMSIQLMFAKKELKLNSQP